MTGSARHGGAVMTGSGGHVVLAGPTTLLIYKAYAFSGGIMFPVYQRMNGSQRKERFRFGVNVSYFFWNR